MLDVQSESELILQRFYNKLQMGNISTETRTRIPVVDFLLRFFFEVFFMFSATPHLFEPLCLLML